MRRLALVLVCAAAVAAHADPVALLPLDAEPALEIYGQPVASEIARALVAGGIEVVVVGPKMAVPDRARLIVDGTIKGDKGGVQLAVRIRDRDSGTVIDTLQSSAASLDTIDRAAADLSSRVLPTVQRRLAALGRAAAPPDAAHAAAKPAGAAPPAVLPIALVALAPSTAAALAPLHDALAGSLDAWVRRGRHVPELGRTLDPKAVAAANAEIGVALDVLAYAVEDLELPTGKQPSARARVRLRVANGTKVVFDRVIATDTVLGDRAHLAELVARDVLWIAEPQLRKVSAWK